MPLYPLFNHTKGHRCQFDTAGMWAFLVSLLLSPVYGVKDLYILGLFPMKGGSWYGGPAIKAAAEIALEHVNNNSNILAGYKLNLIWNNTGCHAGTGINSMYRNLYTPPVKIIIYGPGCSFVSEATAQASHLWNLVQMSWGSVSPALSDKSTFPRFFRANPPDIEINPARMYILKKFGWTKISIIQQTYELFTAPNEDLLRRFRENNMTLLRSEIVTKDPAAPVRNLKNGDVRIIVSGFYEGTAKQVFCEVYKAKLYGPQIVWITVGWYEAEWWLQPDPSIDCNPEQLAQAIEGSFYVSRVLLNPKNEETIAGIKPTKFAQMYRDKNGTENGTTFGSKFAPLSYDSVWAIALALNSSSAELQETGSNLTLEDFSYTDDTVGSVIFNNMKKVRMMGTAGQLSFDDKGDPIGMYTINRIQGGRETMLGLYNPNLEPESQIEWLMDAKWENGKVPRDSILTIVKEDELHFPLYMCICCISAFGAVLSIGFLSFNIYFRAIREVKMSSPRLNNVTLGGCLLLYVTPFLENTNSMSLPGFCTAKGFLLTLGFSLAFGALFAKTWRVHIVVTNSTKTKKIVKDTQLLGMVAGLVGINMIVLLTWVFVDPMKIVSYKLTPEVNNEEDTITQGVVRMCESPNQLYFMATLFALQGILMLLGAFLAWETRKSDSEEYCPYKDTNTNSRDNSSLQVKVDGLNDSKMIGMCVYNVLVLSLLGVTVSMALKFQVNLNYALTSLITILATTVTQCLIFVPKITAVKNRGNQVDDGGEFVTVAGRLQTVAGTSMASSAVTAQRLITVEKLLHEGEDGIGNRSVTDPFPSEPRPTSYRNKEITDLKNELKKYKKE